MKKHFPFILPFLCFAIFSCGNNSNKSEDISSNNNESSSEDISIYPNFDEEFFDGTTIGEYALLEIYLFDIAIFNIDAEGRTPEEEEWRTKCITDPFSFKESDPEQIHLSEYRYRDYYSAFYAYHPIGFANQMITDFEINLRVFPMQKDYIEPFNENTPYQEMVKFKNYANLEDIPYIFENFYLYRVMHLVDIYDGDELITTSFDIKPFAYNDIKNVCFYDVRIDVPHHYGTYRRPYHDSNTKYYMYFDEELYGDKKITPFFPHPIKNSSGTSMMMTRLEYLDGYIYTPKYVNPYTDPSNMLEKEITILEYDATQQKSIEKVIKQYYLKTPVPTFA